MRVLLLSNNLSGNAAGRAYCLWLVARALGAEVDVVGPAPDGIWPVLASTPFADACTVTPVAGDATAVAAARRADVLVAVKPLRQSFGVARQLARRLGKPIVLDIDDPDLVVRMAKRSRRARLGLVGPEAIRRGNHPLQYRRVHAHIRRTVRTVSNPSLQRMYGGRIVPHVREAFPSGRPAEPGPIVVAFVGSPRAHKGLTLVRDAVARLAADGYSLVVTDDPPDDAAPWERWCGTTDLDSGLKLVADADVVALPMLPKAFGPSQFPAKLVDAMMAGRAVVASDLDVLRWATDGAALLVPPDDGAALEKALRTLRDPSVRAELGDKARAVALERYTPDAAAPALSAAIDEAMAAACR